ncbi:MAG: HDOD domain-containing protein [Burkholderiaceae bacterium]|nr:MAG: HDOD domain-containing protein [Burkholderiaceae bacterium]
MSVIEQLSETTSQPSLSEVEIGLWLSTSLRKLPPISPLTPKLMRLKANDDADLDVLQKIIESDPGLSARIIGMANSVYYGATGRGAFKINEALMRLGYQQAWQISLSFVLGSSVTIDPILRSAKQALWAHSYAVGLTAREFATLSDIPNCDPDVAFLGGFVHDIGYLAILALESKKAHAMLSEAQNPAQGYRHGLETHYGLPPHELIGAQLCELWGLPAEIGQLVKHHNEVSPLDIDIPEQGVLCAMSLAHYLAMQVFPPQGLIFQADETDVSDLLANLGIPDKKYDKLHDWLTDKAEGIQFLATSS